MRVVQTEKYRSLQSSRARESSVLDLASALGRNGSDFQIVFGSDLDLVPIEPVVLVEARVLRCDYSVLEIGQDLAERDEFVACVIRSV